MKRLPVLLILVSALLTLSPIEPSAADVDPDLARLSEAPGSAARNLELIHAAVERVNRAKTGSLVFPPGVYEVGNAQALADMEALMTAAHHHYARFEDANIAMDFSGVSGLVVDGGGCTLVFSGFIQPVQLRECADVVIKNLTIDWDRPPFSEGIVRLVKDNILEVEIFPEYPVHGGEPVVSFQSFSLEGGHLAGTIQFSSTTNCELVAPQTVRISADLVRYVKPGDLATLRHVYTYRNLIHMEHCDTVTVEDVTMHAGPGMGVFGIQTRDITLRRFAVRPSGRRMMSINVDGCHFVSCRGTMTIDDCYYQGMGDDAFNMHGRYYFIDEVIDDRTVRAGNQNDENYPGVGDTIEFVRKTTLLTYAEAVITSVDYDPENGDSIIGFDRPLPTGFDITDGIANISQHPKLRFTNTTVRDVRGRALLVQTRDVLIENNHFEHLTGQGIHIDTAYPEWNESVGTRDVVIRNNTFLHCGFGNTKYCDAIAVVVETEGEEPAVGVHRGLIIADNLIIGGIKPAFYLSCLDGAVIRGNRILSNGPAARLDYATNVAFENNNFERSDVVVGIGCENNGISRFQNR